MREPTPQELQGMLDRITTRLSATGVRLVRIEHLGHYVTGHRSILRPLSPVISMANGESILGQTYSIVKTYGVRPSGSQRERVFFLVLTANNNFDVYDFHSILPLDVEIGQVTYKYSKAVDRAKKIRDGLESLDIAVPDVITNIINNAVEIPEEYR